MIRFSFYCIQTESGTCIHEYTSSELFAWHSWSRPTNTWYWQRRKIIWDTTTQTELSESRDKNSADFYNSDVLPISQPTVSKHWRKQYFIPVRTVNKHCNYCVSDRLTVSSYVCVYVDVLEGREAHSTAENCCLRTTTCGGIITSGLSTLCFKQT